MSVFQDHNKIAKSTEDVARIAAENNAKGLTDDGTRPIAKRLEKKVPYYDPTRPRDHGPALVATNTLQEAYAVERGWLTDPDEAHKVYKAAVDARDAAPES